MITYIVLYVTDLQKSKSYYESLGLILSEEKHITGPIHYSFKLNDTVFEIYESKKTSRIRIGLDVVAGQIPIINNNTVIFDPDGNAFDINIK